MNIWLAHQPAWNTYEVFIEEPVWKKYLIRRDSEIFPGWLGIGSRVATMPGMVMEDIGFTNGELRGYNVPDDKDPIVFDDAARMVIEFAPGIIWLGLMTAQAGPDPYKPDPWAIFIELQDIARLILKHDIVNAKLEKARQELTDVLRNGQKCPVCKIGRVDSFYGGPPMEIYKVNGLEREVGVLSSKLFQFKEEDIVIWHQRRKNHGSNSTKKGKKVVERI